MTSAKACSGQLAQRLCCRQHGIDRSGYESSGGTGAAPLRPFFQGGSTDAFVAKIDTEVTGASSLTYLTYFGGSELTGWAVAVDSAQRAYITGATNSSPANFPLLNAFDSTQTNGELSSPSSTPTARRSSIPASSAATTATHPATAKRGLHCG